VSEGVTTVVGIDPGLVHTGIVALSFYPGLKQVEVRSAVIAGDQPGEHVQGALEFLEDHVPDRDHVFVEDYRERGQSYSTSPKMRELMSELMRTLTDGKRIDNTGVKKVVKPKLLDLFQIRKFGTTTHHQDLEAAARILLYGMLKDEELNALVADVVLAHIQGETWQVEHL